MCPTNLIAAVLFILLGISFIAVQGASALSGVYDDLGLTELGFRAQEWVATHLALVSDAVWVALLVVALGAGWLSRRWALRAREVSVVTDGTHALEHAGGANR